MFVLFEDKLSLLAKDFQKADNGC